MLKLSDDRVQALWVILIACCAHFYYQLFLSYDAAYHFYYINIHHDFFIPGDRYSVMLMQWPLVALSFLDSVAFKTYLYGLSYSFLPIISMFGVFHLSKRLGHRYFYYALLGTLTVNVFGFYHILSEHLIAVLCLWPLYGYFSCVIKHKQSKDIAITMLLSLFLFFLHPAAIVIYCLVLLMLLVEQRLIKKNIIVYGLFFLLIIMRLVWSGFQTHLYMQEFNLLETLMSEFSLKPYLEINNIKFFFATLSLVMLYTWSSRVKRKLVYQQSFTFCYLLVTLYGLIAYPYLMHRGGISARFFYSAFAGIIIMAYLMNKNKEDKFVFKPQYLALCFCCVITAMSFFRVGSLRKLESMMNERSLRCFSLLSSEPSKIGDYISHGPHHHWATGHELALLNNTMVLNKCFALDCEDGEIAPFIETDSYSENKMMKCFHKTKNNDE